MSTGCKSSHNNFLDVSDSNGGLRISGWIGQLSCLMIFFTSLSVAAFLRRAGGSCWRALEAMGEVQLPHTRTAPHPTAAGTRRCQDDRPQYCVISAGLCQHTAAPVDIKSWWRHNWKSAQVLNSHLVCYPTIRQPGFDLPRQQWSLLNRFGTEQGYCGAFRRKWRLRHWSVSLWRDPDDVPHCRILSPDKTEWRLISATLCRWRRCLVADQLWFMTRIREEEECCSQMVSYRAGP